MEKRRYLHVPNKMRIEDHKLSSSFRYGSRKESGMDSSKVVELGLSVESFKPTGHSCIVLPMIGQLQGLETKGVAEITIHASFPWPQTGSLRRPTLPTC